MSTAERTFTASEAARISSVSTGAQRDWRHRGFLPPGDRSWTRFTLRDLCRLRLLAAFVHAGLPVGASTQQLVEDFIDRLQLALTLEEARRDPRIGARTDSTDRIAVVVNFGEGRTGRFVVR